MFINEKLVYLAFLKSGCTHVLKLLASIPDLDGKVIGKHNSIYDIDKKELNNFSQKIKSGNIRNPWDWYVSLWAFSCMQRGGLFTHTAKKNILRKLKHPKTFFTSAKEWQKVYSDPEDPELFKKWLEMLLCTRRKDIACFGDTTKIIGYMTYKYFELYTYNFKKAFKTIRTYEQLSGFDQQNNFIDFFITSENLENDFRLLMIKTGIQKEVIDNVLNIPKTNPSQRKHYRDYYNNDLIELVREKDKLIIEKHNYNF